RRASCWIVSAAPRRSMLSVEISFKSSTLLAGPVASTWSGTTVDSATVYPRAGMPAKSGRTGMRRRASRSTWIFTRAGSRRRILMRRGSSGRSMSALSSMRVSPAVALARSRERRTFRSSTPSRMVRGPRSVTLIGLLGGVVTMSPGWSFRMLTGNSTTRSASRSLTLMENQRKKASRSETSFMPGFCRSPSRSSRRLGTRRRRRQGGVGPGGAAGTGSGAEAPGRGRRAKSLIPRPSPGAPSPALFSFHQPALQHDERAHPPRGEVGDALHQLLDRLPLGDAVLGGEERLHADLREGASDVVLEDDEDEHERPAEEVLEQDVDRVDLELPREEVDGVDHPEADQHRYGARAADQVDPPVDDERQDQDVDAILPAETLEELLHATSLPRRASATVTTSRIAPTSWTRTMRA